MISSAARNNAEWCASVCRSHGIGSTLGRRVWHSARRTPPYYPDAVTLHPSATAADLLPMIDMGSAGCSVKDSFATLDLTGEGFIELFTAEWIHREPGPPPSVGPGLRTEQIREAGRLGDWQAAWHGDDPAPDVFRAGLLEDPSVLVLAHYDGTELRGGAVLNHGHGLVGLSNLFAVDEDHASAVWSSSIAAAAERFPGLPLVGYEHGADLARALAAGFTTLGPLRVWLHQT